MGRTLSLESMNKKKLHGFGPYGLGVAGMEGFGDDIVEYLRDGKDADKILPDWTVPDSPLRGSPTSRNIGRIAVGVQAFLSRIFSYRFAGKDSRHWAPSASLLLAGYGIDGATKGIYCLESKEDFFPYKSPWDCIGTSFACDQARIMKSLFVAEHGPSLEQAKLLGVLLVQTAMKRDRTVGGPLQMAIITADSYSDLSREESPTVNDGSQN